MVILITGGTAGIGRATVLALAARGADIVLAVRDVERGEEVADLARRAGAGSVEVVRCDLSLLGSVRDAAAEIRRMHGRLDVLVNDAAVFLGSRGVTAEGFERMFATNYLGPFLLTNLLLDQLAAAAPSREITVTAPSTMAPRLDDLNGERRFSSVGAFGRSKAAELMFTYALARRASPRGIAAFAYHPGVTRTNLTRQAPVWIKALAAIQAPTARTPERAANGLVELAIAPGLETLSGRLIHAGKAIKSPFIDDVEAQERLWSVSERLSGLGASSEGTAS